MGALERARVTLHVAAVATWQGKLRQAEQNHLHRSKMKQVVHKVYDYSVVCEEFIHYLCARAVPLLLHRDLLRMHFLFHRLSLFEV